MADKAIGGTYELVQHTLPKYGIEVSLVDATAPEEIEKAIKPNTKVLRKTMTYHLIPLFEVIYGESPANPTMSLTDLSQLGKIAKKHKITTVFDNTFASPYHQNPISDFGIGI